MEITHAQNIKEATNQSLLITRRDAATRYALSLRTVDSLLSDGVLPAVRLSARCIRIPREQADAALMRFRTGGAR